MNSTNFLTSSRLNLTVLEKSHISKNYLSWLNDAEVCAGNSHHIFPYSMSELEQYVSSSTGDTSKCVLAIETSEGVHIGNISLQKIDLISRSAEYAILLGDKNYWGKGYAIEASMLLLQHGFSSLGLHRVYAGTFSNNTAMQALAQKMGMKEEGRRREAAFVDGSFIDIIEYGILASEFQLP